MIGVLRIGAGGLILRRTWVMSLAHSLIGRQVLARIALGGGFARLLSLIVGHLPGIFADPSLARFGVLGFGIVRVATADLGRVFVAGRSILRFLGVGLFRGGIL